MTFVISLNYFIYGIRYLVKLLFTRFVTSLNYFIYMIRYIVELFKTSFTEIVTSVNCFKDHYGILYLIERFKTWFTWFGTLLNYFRPHLRDSLPRTTISDLIYRIRYHVKLIQTSLTGFVTSFELFATSFTVFVTSFNNFRPHLRDSLLQSYSSSRNHILFHLYVFHTISYLKITLDNSLRQLGNTLNDVWPYIRDSCSRLNIFIQVIIIHY